MSISCFVFCIRQRLVFMFYTRCSRLLCSSPNLDKVTAFLQVRFYKQNFFLGLFEQFPIRSASLMPRLSENEPKLIPGLIFPFFPHAQTVCFNRKACKTDKNMFYFIIHPLFDFCKKKCQAMAPIDLGHCAICLKSYYQQ